MCKKFKDYLIGSKFTVLTDNNPLTYIYTSCLGTAQICWLSDLMLFDFEIKYRAGKSNQVADALSKWPVNPKLSSESLDDNNEWKTVSYEIVCQILNHHLDSTKLPYNVKLEVQNNITDVDMANKSLGLNSTNIIDVQLHEVKLFDTISPSQMAEYQKRDTHLSYVYECVANNSKPKLSEINRVRSKPICRLLLQFDCLSLIWSVLHHHTFKDDELQQLILPQCLCNNVLKPLHDDNSHQGLQCTIDLLHFKVYWPSMFADTNCWLAQCEQCLVTKGDYTKPKNLQGVWWLINPWSFFV